MSVFQAGCMFGQIYHGSDFGKCSILVLFCW